MTVTGVNLLNSDGSASVNCPDIALFRLRENIPIQYNVFHSGWSRLNLTYPQDGICIHHPRGDVKKIAFGQITNPLLSTCHKVTWNNGLTQPGSSGAPLFTNSRLITAVNSHGPNDKNCDDMKYSMFSRIEKSWNKLQPDLSPNDEGVENVFGNDPISACQSVINLNRRFFPGNDWQIKNQITIQASQTVNVANITETSIEQSPFNLPTFNSDYIIRAGNRITINSGFRINSSDRIGSSGVYSGIFTFGNQNRVSFQISPCTPFIDDCGFNHEPAMVIPYNNNENSNDVFSNKTPEYFTFNFTIFPNPTNGSPELNLTSENGFIEIRIMDVFGKVIHKIQPNQDARSQVKISLVGLSQGVYFISVASNDGQFKTQKFVIN